MGRETTLRASVDEVCPSGRPFPLLYHRWLIQNKRHLWLNKRSAQNIMEPTSKTALWTPAYYGRDQSFAKGLMSVIFVEPGDGVDYLLTCSDQACAIKTIISSIMHPEYGEIKGVFDEGLDLYIVRADGTVMVVNAEERPGHLVGSNEVISNTPFSLRLRNPVETGVTLAQYHRLFIQETRILMRQFEEQRIRKELNIPKEQAEQDVPSDVHKPSNHASSTDPTAPADAH